uniref:NADH dehydrogenase subunit 6 n=1 Tax=Anemina arcaeformis TaxID=1903496 RepID=A0A0C4K0S0_9BIVA|nr:NADH dehydrogenase subunit 6 [Anodonta arcaeformis]AHJ59888.1 NADH dehydrogenase subunit 6 [Anodonta arcaeformis]
MTLMIASTLWAYMIFSMTLPMHPLSLGIMVLLLAFINCVLIAMISPWYSYMLFFIFIGGMLVMFAYIASLSPNMTFSVNTPLMPLMTTFMAFFLFNNSSISQSYLTNTSVITPISTMTQVLSFLYTQNGTICVVILACMLLFTLVASVKICKPSSGALRPFIL